MSTVPSTWKEIYRNEKGAVYQCDTTCRLILEFWDTHTAFSARDFLQFKRMVETVDLRQMALHTDDAYDVEILTPPRTDRCYVLTLCEIVQLRDLLNGARLMLELNSLLRERGCCLA
ncbi:hypothetical protein GCM10023189_00650 [Nibrella saemangeumensis]|uniref:Uncharacterized protein n=1 Tax=Nibrella saemangeumensis TaxID=1084526 RepID=A0ABP8M9V9_9BACT